MKEGLPVFQSTLPSVLLSFHLLFCQSGHFLWVVSLTFCKCWHGARNPYEVVHYRAGFSRKFFFVPKIGKMDTMDKNGFFIGKFINFYWIWPIMKIYIICCVSAQTAFLGKFLFLRYGPKCSQPIRLQDFLINCISRRNKWNNWFFACRYKFV